MRGIVDPTTPRLRNRRQERLSPLRVVRPRSEALVHDRLGRLLLNRRHRKQLQVVRQLTLPALVIPPVIVTGSDLRQHRVTLTTEELPKQLRDLRDQSRGRLEVQFRTDRKSTRLNSSHVAISYAVFC